MLHSVFIIIFVQQLYHGVRLVVKSREEFTVIELTQNNNNNAGKFQGGIYSISRGFSRGL